MNHEEYKNELVKRAKSVLNSNTFNFEETKSIVWDYKSFRYKLAYNKATEFLEGRWSPEFQKINEDLDRYFVLNKPLFDFKNEIIDGIKRSTTYKTEREKLDEVVQKISELKHQNQLIENHGELHFEIAKLIFPTHGRFEYMNLIEYRTNFEEILKSKALQKVVKYIKGTGKLYFIGPAWSSLKGNFIYFETEINPKRMKKILNLPDNLVEHKWKDIKAGKEQGLIDGNTGEGVLGTIVN
ncbi:hypothetical protein [Jiulongibacter sp. NS-SX5]|uniref:hypothetical protein n=1 Tax=Jiulongibacter sp. NS-SX5 TaxID=3463854 RepID=UPI00405A2811